MSDSDDDDDDNDDDEEEEDLDSLEDSMQVIEMSIVREQIADELYTHQLKIPWKLEFRFRGLVCKDVVA
ncbi:hypothetical protein Sjap_026387 [Stephania japonica]|uniref:Uncharacterized protein n=1 Tax=Stephania japonica TaxID=461633 RepID=A0AAP0E3I0_9MAGN